MSDADVAALLEEHGVLFHVDHERTNPKRLHTRRRCRGLTRKNPEVRSITHPGEAPLSSKLCRYCDPDVEVDYAAAGASQSLRDVIGGDSDPTMEADT